MSTHRRGTFVLFALVLSMLVAPAAFAQTETHRVTITNITANQIIGPPVLVSHNFAARVFRVGTTASAELAAVAEDADSSGLVASLEANPNVLDVVTGTGPIPPGQSVTLEIQTSSAYPRFSAVGMLVTTNDAFFGVNSFILNGGAWRKTIQAPAYDAGSEANNEDCAFIPGPPCGNPFVRDTAGAEGFVHVHPGVYGVGDLAPVGYNWLNPTASLVTARVSSN